MKTETIVEECLILAHRINKLGGCVMVEDMGHIERVTISIRESKTIYSERIYESFFTRYKPNELGNKELSNMLSKLKKLYQELKEIEKL